MPRLLKLSALLILGILYLCGRASAQNLDFNFPDRKAMIINNCPLVELSDFSFANDYNRDNRAISFIQHMTWKNMGEQPLIAFEIVILKYDAFNRRIIGTRWTVKGNDSVDWSPLEPGKSSNNGTRSFGSEDVFTAIAYIRLARQKNGKIWKANDKELVEKIKAAFPEIVEVGDVKPDPKPKPNDG